MRFIKEDNWDICVLEFRVSVKIDWQGLKMLIYVWLIHLDINTNQLLILVHWKIIKENVLIYINDAVLFSESKLQEPRIILERS